MSGRVLITGAAGALGRSVVERFVDAGERVLAVDADEAALGELTALAVSEVLAVRRVDPASTTEVGRLFVLTTPAAAAVNGAAVRVPGPTP
jgi:nucleoside-diphosphate-sugar epimerase